MTDAVSFDGRVCLVTGAGRGVGRAVAEALGARGASVIVNDTGGDVYGAGSQASVAGEVREQVVAAGGIAVADTTDIGDADAVAELVARIDDRFGQLDCIVAAAGISWHRPVAELTAADIDRSLEVNLAGPAHLCRLAWPLLCASETARVVLTSSSGIFGFSGRAHYVAAKAGLIGLARALSVEGAQYGVGVNTVLPWAKTRMATERHDAFGQWFDQHFGPERVAPAICWLCHPDCETSGEAFSVEGGRMARVALVTGSGWTDPTGGPETFRDHWDQVMSVEPGIVPADTLDYLRRAVQPCFPTIGD